MSVITIEPKLFGQGVNLLTEKLDLNLELREVKRLDERVVLLKYAVRWG